MAISNSHSVGHKILALQNIELLLRCMAIQLVFIRTYRFRPVLIKKKKPYTNTIFLKHIYLLQYDASDLLENQHRHFYRTRYGWKNSDIYGFLMYVRCERVKSYVLHKNMSRKTDFCHQIVNRL